jgi:diaminohydroxyphosphoribosylaminopyrimidine deaminase/5-amino-6-(5-phosphoribosylamino)uracil reductase
MESALALAKLALGQVSPNPAVGAVIVKNNTVVGQGYTQPPGSWHAEIAAIKQAGEKARGAALYVTLEPCCHHGRTPPCTRTIIEAGIMEVHLAMLDPNPLVSGRGRAELEQAGIKVYAGKHEQEAADINEAYTKYITTGKPFITAKFAMSLDGKIATRSGESRWISGEGARRYVHNLRYINDGIMVGINTVVADDPHLTARCCGGRGGTVKKQPLRVIVDSVGRTPLSSRVLSEPGKTVIALGKVAAAEETAHFLRPGIKIVELPGEGQRVDLNRLLEVLGSWEITSLLVEGGATLLGSLFDEGLVDKVIAFVAPVIIGGEKAKTAVGGNGVEKLANSIRLKHVTVERCGEDIMVTGYVKEKDVHRDN